MAPMNDSTKTAVREKCVSETRRTANIGLLHTQMEITIGTSLAEPSYACLLRSKSNCI